MPESALQEIHAALRQMLPAGVVASAGAIDAAAATPAPGEIPWTVRMSPRRLQEFSAGREHARRALGQLGLTSPEVPVGPDRAPLWPRGYVGSISHAGDLALAVAASSTRIRSIGVDLEPDVPLDEDLVHRVCRTGELSRLPASIPLPRWAKLIFSAKESVYKCTAPLTGVFLEFEDVEILFEPAKNRFRARGHGPAADLIGPSTIAGTFTAAGGYWLTAAWQEQAADGGQERV